jgi:hypothetical protein
MSNKEPDRLQLRKHWSFLLIVIGLILSVLASNVIYSHVIFSKPTDEYAQYSFVMSILVAVALAVFFWYLQKQDNDKMQEVLDKINTLVSERAKIDADKRARQNKRKQFWLNVANTQLFIIRSNLTNLLSHYNVILKESPSEERINEIEQMIKSDRFTAVNAVAPTLNSAMSQIADLLSDDSLVRDVDSTDFTWFLEDADVHMPSQRMKTAITMIEVAKEKIDSLLERLKTEMATTL